MITSLYFSFLFFILNCSSLPLIITFMIMAMSLGFLFIWFYFGSCWFPLIFSLLFMGGILVVFMVVSSLFPNLNNFSYYYTKNFFYFFMFVFIFYSFFHYVACSTLDVKYFCALGGPYYCSIIIILTYFFSFLFIVSKDKVSLRSFL